MTKQEIQGLSYDEAMARAEEIIRALEQTEALQMRVYREKAAEATALLQYCREQVVKASLG